MRFKALETANSRPTRKVPNTDLTALDYYGINVFNDETMMQYLDKESYKAVRNCIDNGERLDRELASRIASGMKSWSMEKGATHYTHWFQPLTGSTAEKHDSFFEPDNERAIAKFSGDSLVQQEPDASSLPSGGLRNTFEARGYTAWDPSSPAFIYENSSGKTLCIPTVFVSYNGQALDYKAPLLKSLDAVSKAATDVCSYFYDDVKKVKCTLGVEQEYFLVDKALYQLRPDLVLTGRTLFGYAAAKNQQLDDHYFGSIPDRVFNYMYDMEMEAHKLGIPLRTRHNEVAPGQYECAPQFEEINLAVDHNQLLMDLMDEVADRHGFKVLLHEKPFAGINGSGKHNNWSLGTDTGVNLLSPGDNPQSSLSFLTFFINTIKAVHDHADLIRASIASAGNDHRLGANEAPPAIISIFIGSTLTEVLNNIEKGIEGKSDSGKSINIAQIPEILVDNTDRNRTSPFAFTGNKFELRAVGSTTNCASPMTVLNAAMANQLVEFKSKVDKLISGGKGKEAAILEVLRSELTASKRILFEGNGYGDEWVKEAEKRGLSNIKETPEALKAYISESTVDLMSKLDVLTEEELEARYDITLEAYHKCIQIEGRVIDEMAYTHVIPAAVKYQKIVAEAVERQLAIGISKDDLKPAIDLLNRLNTHLNAFAKNVQDMVDARRKANKQEDNESIARSYAREVRSYFDEIRYHADKMERLIDDDLWELPKYRELLFIK